MNSFHLLSIIAVVSLLSFVLGANLFSVAPVTSVAEEKGTSISYHAAVCKVVTRADGTQEDLGCSHNLFNQDGMNATRDCLAFNGGSNCTIIRVIALANITHEPSGSPGCNNTQGAPNQSLCGEYTHSGLQRADADAVRLNATASSDTAGNWTITRQFTNTGSGALDVNGTGLFNDTTPNGTREIFFAQNTFTTATLQVNDKINVTWFIWVV